MCTPRAWNQISTLRITFCQDRNHTCYLTVQASTQKEEEEGKKGTVWEFLYSSPPLRSYWCLQVWEQEHLLSHRQRKREWEIKRWSVNTNENSEQESEEERKIYRFIHNNLDDAADRLTAKDSSDLFTECRESARELMQFLCMPQGKVARRWKCKIWRMRSCSVFWNMTEIHRRELSSTHRVSVAYCVGGENILAVFDNYFTCLCWKLPLV